MVEMDKQEKVKPYSFWTRALPTGFEIPAKLL